MAALVIDSADSVEQPGSPIIETNIPARLERLLWGRFQGFPCWLFKIRKRLVSIARIKSISHERRGVSFPPINRIDANDWQRGLARMRGTDCFRRVTALCRMCREPFGIVRSPPPEHQSTENTKRIIVVCRAAIFLLVVGQNTLMLAECDRTLAMVRGDQAVKLAAVPLVASAAAAEQPQVVVLSVVSAAAQQPQVVATRKGLI
jgi:hypothetical protein